LIAGFDFPSQGSIRLHGTDIEKLPPNARRVTTVFQNYALFPHLTVAKNISFGLETLRWPRAEIGPRVAEMLRLVRL
jgi:spermidine/putrescine transport system ATP-binding protein